MNLIDRFGDIFQLSYVTHDRDTAVSFAISKMGIDNFHCFDGKCAVHTRNGLENLVLRVAVANTAKFQFEIIEPVSGPTWIYTEGYDLDRQLLTLHHVGVAVVGSYADWEKTIAKLRADGDEITQISQLLPGEEPKAMFAYADNRCSLGHYTEYLWWDPSMNGTPTMPKIKQGA